MISREVDIYETWSDFKFELQRRSGTIVLNNLWLQIKPKAPLPWYEYQMREAMEQLSASDHRKTSILIGQR